MSKKKNHAETIAALEKRLAQLRLRERVSERKTKERMKYLVGAFVLNTLPSMRDVEKPNFSWKDFDRWLTRDTDRKVFGLPPKQDNRIILNVPEERKAEAKSLGAKWDSEQKTWYVPEGVDPSPFTLNGWM